MNKSISELKVDYMKSPRNIDFSCECEFCNAPFTLTKKTAFKALKNEHLLCRKCKIKCTKSLVSKEDQERINKKREETFLKKYGVSTTLVSEKAKKARENIDQEKRVSKILETKRKRGTLRSGEGLKNVQTYKKTQESLKKNKGVNSYFEIINKNRSLIKYEKIKKAVEDFSELLNDSNNFSVIDKNTKEYTLIRLKCKSCGNEYINTRTEDIKRCPLCFPEDWSSRKKSKGERVIEKFLEERDIKYIPQKIFKGLVGDKGNPLRFDFYIPQHNMCIEYQGKQHFYPYNNTEVEVKALKKRQKYDNKKREYCKENNIRLETILYTDNIHNYLQEIFDQK